jgi:hypothetical protein
MFAKGTLKLALFALLVFGGSAVFAPQASAQSIGNGFVIFDGEPTDPEQVVRLLGESGIDHDLPASAPSDAAEFIAWLEELLNLLRSLGLYPPGEPGS